MGKNIPLPISARENNKKRGGKNQTTYEAVASISSELFCKGVTYKYHYYSNDSRRDSHCKDTLYPKQECRPCREPGWQWRFLVSWFPV